MDNIKANSADFEKTRAEAQESQQHVIELARTMSQSSRELRDHYDAYFDALSRAADETANRATVAARREAEKLEAAKIDAARVEAARVEAARIEAAKMEAARIAAADQAAKARAAASLAGSWVFISAADPALPGRFAMDLTDTGTQVEGRLTVLQTPKEWALTPRFDCGISGPKTFKEALKGYAFSCGTAGELQILPQSASQIEVVWKGNSKGKSFFFDQVLERTPAR